MSIKQILQDEEVVDPTSTAKGTPAAEALRYLQLVTMHQDLGNLPSPTALDFLQSTVLAGSLKVFRGLNIAKPTEEQLNIMSALNSGDPLPETFWFPPNDNPVVHATKKLVVAAEYASYKSGEGLSVIYSFIVPKHDVVVDSTNLRLAFQEADLSPSTWEYFAREAEVICLKSSHLSEFQIVAFKRPPPV